MINFNINDIYDKHPYTHTKNRPDTFNELAYMLRVEPDKDFNVNIYSVEDEEHLTGTELISCIPSIKDTFVNIHTLARYVICVTVDQNFSTPDVICLDVYLSDKTPLNKKG